MKKLIAAIAALLLLSMLLVIKLPESSPPLPLTVNNQRHLVETTNITEQFFSSNNAKEVTLSSTVMNNAIKKNNLDVNFSLRNYFDDIIHQHKQQKSLNASLKQLAIKLNLTQQAESKLKDLFNRYQQYLLAISELKRDAPAVTGIIDISESQLWLQQVYELQYELFIESEITAFFSKEKNYDQQALTRVAIRQDLSLSKAQKNTLIEHQISQLEPTEFAALKPTISANKIAALLNDSSTAQSSIDSELTEKQIERINTTQQKNRVWQDKIKAYKAQIVTYKQLDKDIFLNEMKRYQQQHFTKNELKRLQVFLKNPQLLN